MTQPIAWKARPVGTWAEFHRRVKVPGKELLERLDDFGNSVLVAGCQRSGTTALTHLLSCAPGMADYAFGEDSELDGALLLAGQVARFTNGRHCFQTTYLNDRFPEYFRHDSFRLIWVLREPRSVIYSMLYNWRRGALNRVYGACGSARIDELRRGAWISDRWRGPSWFEKACASYIGKTEQTFALRRHIGDRMLIVDYDDLVSDTGSILNTIADFVDVPFDPDLALRLHPRSLRRGDHLVSWQASRVDEVCRDVYHAARDLRYPGRPTHA